MLIYESFTEVDEPLGVVTIGNFDGVHLGHRELFARVRERADALGLPASVYTFEPHPARIFNPDLAPPTITPREEKQELFAEVGFDHAVFQRFDLDYAGKPPEVFEEEVLVRHMRVREVVVGYDFKYGSKRAGNTERLVSRGRDLGFGVHIVPAVEVQGIVSSSTKIRSFLMQGRVAGAAMLLGRPYRISGTVVEGDRRGHTLGFPTANVDTAHEIVPSNGVYAVRASTDQGVERDAVANIGVRPTFYEGTKRSIEVHLFDFDGDLYGQHFHVDFVRRLRDERRFSGAAELMAQIHADCAAARDLLTQRGGEG